MPVEFIQKLCQASTGRKTRDKTQESGKDATGHPFRIPVLYETMAVAAYSVAPSRKNAAMAAMASDDISPVC